MTSADVPLAASRSLKFTCAGSRGSVRRRGGARRGGAGRDARRGGAWRSPAAQAGRCVPGAPTAAAEAPLPASAALSSPSPQRRRRRPRHATGGELASTPPPRAFRRRPRAREAGGGWIAAAPRVARPPAEMQRHNEQRCPHLAGVGRRGSGLSSSWAAVGPGRSWRRMQALPP